MTDAPPCISCNPAPLQTCRSLGAAIGSKVESCLSPSASSLASRSPSLRSTTCLWRLGPQRKRRLRRWLTACFCARREAMVRFGRPLVTQVQVCSGKAHASAPFLVLPADSTAGSSQAGQRGAALSALQHHVWASRAAAQPVLSPEAEDLLAAYFKHVRTFAEAQQGVVASLARVACASARLRHSPVVRLVPDAALAVAFLEEKLLAADVGPTFWPRWRAELRCGADLDECLAGLAEDCCAGLGCAGGGWQTAAEE